MRTDHAPHLFPATGTIALVHPDETNAQHNIDCSDTRLMGARGLEESFRHSGSARTRRRVHAALIDASIRHGGWIGASCSLDPSKDGPIYHDLDDRPLIKPPVTARRIDAYERCGHNAWVMRSTADPTKYRVSCDRCNDRFCQPCSAERAYRIRSKLHDKIKSGVHRFVTLTLRTGEEPLKEQLQKLYAAFRRLRNRLWWKRRVTGGIVFVEIKWSEGGNRWHPHLHVLVQGRYLPCKELAAEWYQCTGDSYIVDVRIVKDTARAADYVAKYATKGYAANVLDDHDRLVEAIGALHGRRLVIVFGLWRGFRLNDPPSDEGWTVYMSLHSLIARVRCGDERAERVLATLKHEVDAEWSRWTRPPPEQDPQITHHPDDPPRRIPHVDVLFPDAMSRGHYYL